MTGNGAVPARQGLRIEDLTARLHGFLLDRVSFTTPPAQVTALLGHNGTGKTTTLRIIMNMVRKDGGRVTVGSFDHQRDEKAFKQLVGFVPEESFFYGRMTVGELLRFAAGFYPTWNWAFCDQLLARFEMTRDRRLDQLSKGMRTKVGLIEALSHEPDVLVLDEPSSGLDPRARAALWSLLDEAAHVHGRALLLSTHDLTEVERLADRIVIIDDGHVVEEGALATLRARGQAGQEWSLEHYFLEKVL